MAITLRYTGTDTGGSADELTYQEMNDNFKSFYYSSSFASNTLVLHTTGSTNHSIDLSSLLDDTNTNMGNTSLTLTGNRTLDLSTYNLTFDALQGNNINFAIENAGVLDINLVDGSLMKVGGLLSPASSGSYYIGYNTSTGLLTYHATSSIPGQGGTDTNIYNTDGNLTAARTVAGDGNDLTFDFRDANFTIRSEENQQVAIVGLPTANSDQVLAIDGSGILSLMPTSSIPGQGGTDTNIYNTDGTLTAARTVTANGNKLTFSSADADFQISSGGGTGGDVIITDLRQASTDSMMMINAGTGVVSWMSTGSLNVGGSTSPGGSDTYVQFNDGGSTFGGDSGFTYNKTANRVTITAPSSPTRTAPNLLLNSEVGNVAVNEVFGVIAANNTTDQYSPASYPASIQFTADTTFGPGNYDARIGLFVNNNATETEALRLRSSGQTRLPQYGAGNFTGTAAKYLAVSSSGDIIETTSPMSLSRPASVDQAVDFDEILNADQETWTYVSGFGTPTSTNFTANSATVSSITALKIHHTSGQTGDLTAAFDTISSGGTIQLGDDNTPSNTASATVRQVVDNGTYHTIYVSNWTILGLTSLTSVTARIGFSTDKQVELSDKAYNRITLKNSVGAQKTVRFKAPSTASTGDYILVEVTAEGTNANNMLLEYVYYTTGTTTTFTESSNAIYYHNNAATLTQLNINSTYQQAIIEFRVTPSGNLALMGADKVLR